MAGERKKYILKLYEVIFLPLLIFRLPPAEHPFMVVQEHRPSLHFLFYTTASC